MKRSPQPDDMAIAPTAPPPLRRWEWMLAGLLVAAVAAFFWPALLGDFLQWDDDINITQNPHIQAWSWENLKWMFTDFEYMRRYVPLAWVSFALNNALFGMTPVSFHAVNLVLHGLGAVLVYFILRKLLQIVVGQGAEGTAGMETGVGVIREGGNGLLKGGLGLTLCAFVGALLWAVHPLRVEVVAWASGRICCQSLVFLMGALLAYLHYGTATSPGKRRWAYGLSVGAYAASMLTYPLGLTFPFVLIVLDIWLFGRISSFKHQVSSRLKTQCGRVSGNTWAGWLVEKLPYFLVMAAIFAVTLWARWNVRGRWESTMVPDGFGLAERGMQAAYIWAHYVWQPWWPVSLAPVNPVLVDFKPWGWPFVASAVGVAGLTAVLLWKRRQWPTVCALWLCHLLFLVPFLGLTEHPHYPSDRYSYFQGVFWVAAISLLLWKAVARPGLFRASLLGAVLLAGFCGMASLRQTAVWQNSGVLFQTMLDRVGPVPYRADIYWRLAGWHFSQHQYAPGESACRKALEIAPSDARLHLRLAEGLVLQGKLEDALGPYQETIRLDPANLRAHENIASILVSQDRNDEALPHVREALRQQPRSVKSRMLLVSLLLDEGNQAQAQTELRQALQDQPEPADRLAILFELGELLLGQRKWDEAAARYDEILRLNPAHAQAIHKLALIAASRGQTELAVQRWRQALRLNPDWPEACNNLAWILATDPDPKLRNGQEAVDLARRACQQVSRPNASLWDTRAAAHAEAGQFDEAVRIAREGIKLAASRQPELMEELRARLELYLAKQPYHTAPRTP